MKKIYTMLMTAMMALVMISCEDAQIARTLEGTWKGDMYISTRYNGVDYDVTYSVITFDRYTDTYSSGTGYWTDYYDGYTPWGQFVANHINWEVRNGTIYVDFLDEGSSIRIDRYELNDDWFIGDINDGRNSVHFELYHTSRPVYNYNSYGYRNRYYYTRGDGADSTEVEKPVRFVKPALKAK